MNVEAIEARFQLLEAQVKEEREARLGLEEKNLSLEEQLKKQANNRETDLLRFTTTNNQLKAQLKETQQVLEVKIQQEAEERNQSKIQWEQTLEEKIQQEAGKKKGRRSCFGTKNPT